MSRSDQSEFAEAPGGRIRSGFDRPLNLIVDLPEPVVEALTSDTTVLVAMKSCCSPPLPTRLLLGSERRRYESCARSKASVTTTNNA